MMNRNRIYHGLFGRVVLLEMCHPLVAHAHPQPHIIVKIGGSDGAMGVCGRNLPLTSETVVLINAWEPHSYVGSQDGPAFLLAFFLDPAWLTDLRSPRRELRFEQHCVPRTTELKRLVNRFVGHMLHDFAVEQPILEQLVGEMTMRATNLSEHQNAVRTADFRIRRTIQYIREHPGDHLNTAELAAISGLSVPHFFERFKESTGLTPHGYVKVVKMEQAFNALTSGQFRIGQVSDNLGFKVQSHFTRFFREHTGITPNRYRQVTQVLD
ncbi:helix-turn-helix transcriptional regulator [Pseudorhodoplanes sp.]|uniref:helix-turn-helix transcriptional regulator n=1 Tax=Pseudorhodoplanes sp. TaxID=1934341 RepID=UPI003D0A4557